MAKFFDDIESSALNVYFSHKQSSIDNVDICIQCEKLLQCVRNSVKESICAFSLEILTSGWWIVIS